MGLLTTYLIQYYQLDSNQTGGLSLFFNLTT